MPGMNDTIDIAGLEAAQLVIIHYPDERLARVSRELRPEEITPAMGPLLQRMFELMEQGPGVGLAAPQVGINLRFFVANATGEPEGKRVYINPVIIAGEGWAENEEGCLSLPGISCRLKRRATVTVRALDLTGNAFEETGTDLQARIFQHEIDHLDGTTIADRMSTVARLANRRALKRLEEEAGK